MAALIIGADRLGKIPDVLKENGYSELIHIPGRKKGMRNYKIPSNVDVVIFMIDFLEHCTMKNFKQQLKGTSIPSLYCRRSASDVQNKLANCSNCGLCNLN